MCVYVCVLKGLGEESRRMHAGSSLGHLFSTRVQGGDGYSLFRPLLFNSLLLLLLLLSRFSHVRLCATP